MQDVRLPVVRISISHPDGSADTATMHVANQPSDFFGGGATADDVAHAQAVWTEHLQPGQPVGIWRNPAQGGLELRGLSEAHALGAGNYPLLDAEHAAKVVVSKLHDPSLLGIGIRDGSAIKLLARFA